MAFFNEFPHTRTYDSDLGWLIGAYQKLTDNVDNLDAWKIEHQNEYYELLSVVNTLKNNLIQPVTPWDATKSYKIYSMVSDNGSNYIAIQDVLPGIMIGDTDYWLPANTVTAQLNVILATIYDVLNKAGDPFTVNSFDNAVLHNIFHTPASGYQASGLARDDNYTYVSFVSTSVGAIDGYIVKYSNADGSVIDTLYDDIYHSNSLTIINGVMYSADCLIITSDGYTPVSTISVIDPETMTLTGRLTTNLAATFTAVYNINDELYAMTAGAAVYKIDTLSGIAGYIKQLPFESSGITQGATYYDGKVLFCRYNPNLIEVYDYDANVKMNNIQIGFTIPEAGTITELESVYVHGNDLYFLGTSSTGGCPCYRVRLDRVAASGPKDRLGSYLAVLHVDGLPNTEDRIKNNNFERPSDAIIRAKGFSGAKIRISIDADAEQDLMLEGVPDMSVTLVTSGSAVFKGSVYLYDGDFTFNGKWLANNAHQIYVNTTNRLASNVVLQGEITDASTAHDFFSTNSNANMDLLVDLTMSGSSAGNLTFNLQNGMRATFSARTAYKISQTPWSYLYSPAYHNISGTLGAKTMFRKTGLSLNLTDDTTYDIGANLGINLSYGNRVILVTAIGDCYADFVTTQSNHRQIAGSANAAPIMLHIRLTANSLRVFKYKLSNGNWVADATPVSVSQIIVI